MNFLAWINFNSNSYVSIKTWYAIHSKLFQSVSNETSLKTKTHLAKARENKQDQLTRQFHIQLMDMQVGSAEISSFIFL